MKIKKYDCIHEWKLRNMIASMNEIKKYDCIHEWKWRKNIASMNEN